MDTNRLKGTIQRWFALATERPVAWCDDRFPQGDFEGRDATLEIFDIETGSEWDLQRRLRKLRKSASAGLGVPLRLMFHTREATTRVYPWVRVFAPLPASRQVRRSVRDMRGDLDFVLRLVRRVWPEAIVQDTDTGLPDRPILQMFPVHPSSELIIFRDDTSRDSWNVQGTGEAEPGPVLVVRVHGDRMAFVIERDKAETERMVDEIVTAIGHKRLPPRASTQQAAA